MNSKQKAVVIGAAMLLLATWLWPAWYQQFRNEWTWQGHHFALTFWSYDYPTKLDWDRLIVYDLIVLAPSVALAVLFGDRSR